jgi:hypothetical protein
MIELLVVIPIIAVLIALLLSAVEQAREAARGVDPKTLSAMSLSLVGESRRVIARFIARNHSSPDRREVRSSVGLRGRAVLFLTAFPS